MEGSQYWPEVADALEELNDWARTALAIGPQRHPHDSARFPWPTWAPAPGSWVRQAFQWRDKRVNGTETWHIAGPNLFEHEANYFRLRPLCGREIRIEPDGQAGSVVARHACDVRGEPSPADKECWHCRRKLGLIDRIDDGALHRPWGDIGARAYAAAVPLR